MKYSFLLLLSSLASVAVAQQLEWAGVVGGPGYISPRGMATNADGQVYLATHAQSLSEQYDFDPGLDTVAQNAQTFKSTLAKYSSAGAVLWHHAFEGGNIEITDLCLDGTGNLYITGHTSSGDSVDFQPGPGQAWLHDFGAFAAKYNADGQVQWLTSDLWLWYGLEPIEIVEMTYANAIVVNENGVYITGQYSTFIYPGIQTACATVFLDQQGLQTFNVRSGLLPIYLLGTDIAVDDDGYIYVTGAFGGTINFQYYALLFDPVVLHSDYITTFVAKYQPDGSCLWAKKLNGMESPCPGYNPYSSINYQKIHIHENTLLLAGQVTGQVDLDADTTTQWLAGCDAQNGYSPFFLASYSLNLDLQWAVVSQDVNGHVAAPHSLTTDEQGYIYLAGTFSHHMDADPSANASILQSEWNIVQYAGQVWYNNPFITKYDSSGSLVWAERLASPLYMQMGQGTGNSTAISVDGNENLVVAANMGGILETDFGPNEYLVEGSGVLLASYSQPCSHAGCMNMTACNYNPYAQCDINCMYPGCTELYACNYDPQAGCNEGCLYNTGCTDPASCNYYGAQCEDGSCTYPGCSDMQACNFNSLAGCNDGSCVYPGCTDPDAYNYNPIYGCDDGSCYYAGCTDPVACNYNAAALVEDGSCDYTSCQCPTDINNDGVTNTSDLLLFMSAFGCSGLCETGDINNDGAVNTSDLLLFMSAFGQACD